MVVLLIEDAEIHPAKDRRHPQVYLSSESLYDWVFGNG